MNTRSWMTVAAAIVVGATAAVVAAKYRPVAEKPAPAPAAMKDPFPVPPGLTVEISGLMQQRDYSNAMALLQVRLEKVKGDKAATAQVQYFMGICAQRLWAMNQVGRPTMLADVNTDPWTTLPRVPHKPMLLGEVRDMTIKELGNFDYEADQAGPIPEDVQALNGGKVRLTGYMGVPWQVKGEVMFNLVPTLGPSCWGLPTSVQHVVIVKVPQGMSVASTSREVVAEGTLKVAVRTNVEGRVEGIFEVMAESVKVGKER